MIHGKCAERENTMVAFKSSSNIKGESILNGLDSSVVVIDDRSNIVFLNSSAEQFFASSQTQLKGKNISQLLPIESPLMSLIEQVQTSGSGVSDHGLTIDTPRITKQLINVQVTPMLDNPGFAILNISFNADTLCFGKPHIHLQRI